MTVKETLLKVNKRLADKFKTQGTILKHDFMDYFYDVQKKVVGRTLFKYF